MNRFQQRRQRRWRNPDIAAGYQEMESEIQLVGALYHAPALFAFLRHHAATRAPAEDLLLDVFVLALESERLAKMAEDRQLAWLWRAIRPSIIIGATRQGAPPSVGMSLHVRMLAARIHSATAAVAWRIAAVS